VRLFFNLIKEGFREGGKGKGERGKLKAERGKLKVISYKL
jgi:hypothetical protein